MVIVLGLLLLVGATEGGRLLRVPRIYNALITSEEDLLPSQAYPAVAPVLRPAVYLPAAASAHATGLPAAGRPFPGPPPGIDDARPQLDLLPQADVKNNRPPNPDIPDVPPPPIPVGKPPSQLPF